ncbi:MAG: cytochrome b N-terminal domain-containing protein [Planctomycetes bacterium]|nr:cytochrome b N-terminal domain-containing protein [Planctomycetota bacterium]
MLKTFWSLLRSPVPPTERADLLLALVILFLFFLQVATGILLAFFYQPSPVTVADSVQLIMRDVDWGWVVRGLHHWSAHAILVLCGFQVLRILYLGTWRGRASSSWNLGLLVLLCAILLSYTGELLVWDQSAFWRITRALEQVESAPIVGTWVAHVLRGGEEVSATTLSRVFSVHSLLLPWVLWVLVVFEGWFFAQRLRVAKEARS